MDFYKRLNYSLGNEDWFVEAKALNIRADDHAICVTASGDRPLNLLTTACASVTAVDMNPNQSHLLALKLAAITQLDYEKYLAFLGMTAEKNRYAIFNEFKCALPAATLQYWQQQRKLIQRGIIYQGKVEQVTKCIATIFTLFRKKDIATLFSFTDIAEQREFVRNVWDRFFMRKTFDIVVHPKMVKLISNDPGLSAYVHESIHPGKYIYQRMIQYLHQHLARKSILLQLILLGKILPDAYLPYLTFDGYTKIRAQAARLHYYTDNIIDYLQQLAANSINAFSMSDIASYMPQSTFEQMLSSIYHAAAPNARFCIREFMSQRDFPAQWRTYLIRNEQQEQLLEKEETNFVYRFMVGEVKKN